MAALAVLFYHVDQRAALFDVKSLGFSKGGLGGYAVTFFFVLSGFLITYLLMVEKEKTNKISVRNFYLRRIFRIWPLYYLILFVTLILSFFISSFSSQHAPLSFFLYFFMLSNVATAYPYVIVAIESLWSISVEEQFYLIWPHIINKVKNIKSVKYYLFGIFITYFAVKIGFRLFFEKNHIEAASLIVYTRFSCMAIGGMGAYLFFFKSTFLKYIYNPIVQIIAWSFWIYTCLVKPVHVAKFFDDEIHSVAFLIIILNVSTNPATLINLEKRFLNFLGKISYGIYVYHMPLIYVLSVLFKSIDIKANYLIITATVLFLTIGISYLSYTYFENPFLRLKEKFAVIKSTNTA